MKNVHIIYSHLIRIARGGERPRGDMDLAVVRAEGAVFGAHHGCPEALWEGTVRKKGGI